MRKFLVFFIVASIVSCVACAPGKQCDAAGFSTEIFRAAAVGMAVNAAAEPLNDFINTFTARNNVPIGTSTKVVPILSVGEKGYVGAAQVAGPSAEVKATKAVWLYEDNFSKNEFRLKVYVPSASLNPLELKRTQKVGVSAIIDVSLDGRWKGQTFSRSVGVGEIIKAGVVAIAINTAADPLNRAINSITKSYDANTKVVPIVSIGDKAYIGGVQVSGPSGAVNKVKSCYQYEEIFDGGKFRIKIFVPSDSTSPLKIKRVGGVGITALIDTSIADQERIRERREYWMTYHPRYRSIKDVLDERFRGDIIVLEPRHDQGLHKGWYIGKGNQRKLLTGVWVDRYLSLGDEDREEFVIWWNAHYKDKPDELEIRWREWVKSREEIRNRSRDQERERDQDRNRPVGRDEERGKGKAKGRGK